MLNVKSFENHVSFEGIEAVVSGEPLFLVFENHVSFEGIEACAWSQSPEGRLRTM